MSDNPSIDPGTSPTLPVQSEDLGTGQAQEIILRQGEHGATTRVSATHPLPISDAGGSITVDGTFWQATQPVSGTVTITPSGTQTVSGTVTANAGTGTFAVSAASLPLPSGASTAAKQPALGTAGTASTDVLTVQGIASMTALKVDGSATTQPVSGTITANAGTGTMAVSAASLPLPTGAAQDATLTGGTQKSKLVDTGGTNVASVSAAGALKVDNSGVTQPVSGTVTANAGTGTMAVSAASLPLPTGAATAAKQPALGTAGTPSTDVISVQGVTSMTALKVDGSGVTQPVSGTVTANIGTSGSLALDATLTGGTQKSKLVDSGGTNVATVSAGGALKVDGSAVTQPVSGTVTTSPPSNASTNVAQINGVTPLMGNGTSGTGALRVAIVSDQTQLTNALKVDGSGVTQPISGTVTATGTIGTELSTGLSIYSNTALSSTKQQIKASAGKVYGWMVHNPSNATAFIQIWDVASGSITVGTTAPTWTIPLPAGASANVMSERGVTHATAINLAATTTATGSSAPSTALVVSMFYI